MYEKSAEAKLFSYQYTTISEILGVILNDSSFIFEGVIVKTSNIISLRTSQIDFSKGKKVSIRDHNNYLFKDEVPKCWL